MKKKDNLFLNVWYMFIINLKCDKIVRKSGFLRGDFNGKDGIY